MRDYILLWVPRDFETRRTTLATPGCNSKLQTCPRVREDTSHQQTRNCLVIIKNGRKICRRSQMDAWHQNRLADWASGRNMSWVEFILWPTVSRPVRLVIGLPFGAHDQILSFPFFSDNCFVVVPVGRPLWREDGRVMYSAIADWSGHWGPINIHYRLIWDCVPFMSPLTTRRDYGGGILTRLHTGL
jgi:hypothetical protein